MIEPQNEVGDLDDLDHKLCPKLGKNAIMFGSPDLRRNQAWIRDSAMQKERK